jgi:hypothetical protein
MKLKCVTAWHLAHCHRFLHNLLPLSSEQIQAAGYKPTIRLRGVTSHKSQKQHGKMYLCTPRSGRNWHSAPDVREWAAAHGNCFTPQTATGTPLSGGRRHSQQVSTLWRISCHLCNTDRGPPVVLPVAGKSADWATPVVQPVASQSTDWATTVVLPVAGHSTDWATPVVLPVASQSTDWATTVVLPVAGHSTDWATPVVLPVASQSTDWANPAVLPVASKSTDWATPAPVKPTLVKTNL